MQTIKDDLISRKDAILALGEKPIVPNEYDEYSHGRQNQWTQDMEAIQAIPSTQSEIMTCKDCKYRWDEGEPDKYGYYLCYRYEAQMRFCSEYEKRVTI